MIQVNPWVTKTFSDAINILKDRGATVVDTKFLEWHSSIPSEAGETWNLARRVEFEKSKVSGNPISLKLFFFSLHNRCSQLAIGINRFLSSTSTQPLDLRTLDDVIRYTKETKNEKYEAYGADELEMSAEAGKAFAEDPSPYEKAASLREHFSTEIPRMLEAYNCDLLIAPTGADTTAYIGGNPQVSVPLPPYPDNWPIKRRPDGAISEGPGIP